MQGDVVLTEKLEEQVKAGCRSSSKKNFEILGRYMERFIFSAAQF